MRVDRLLDFFKRVSICLQETICAGKPIRAFLLPYAVDMTLYFGGYISDRRRTEVAFATELEDFVRSTYPEGLPVSALNK